MGEKVIYLLFTDTGTLLARAIRYFTKQPLNHVSISFDRELRDVYSFGRKSEKNPFSGGFVKENVRSDFLKSAQCEIYQLTISDQEFDSIVQKIHEIEASKDQYKYNFLGLFGVLLQIEWKRRNAFFCSQFIASLLNEIKDIQFGKSLCFVKPEDIQGLDELTLIYRGTLENYFVENEVEEDYVSPIFIPLYVTKKL